LITLLKDCVSSWQNIPSPDNQFIRTDVNVLQILKINDQLVEDALN